jgi:glycogen debranching enzyme
MQPFGILLRDIERVPYLADKEYHGATIWPRDTPYLLELMEGMGKDVLGLLVSNLDHMVSEGAIGYCSELFSLPVGENPNPCPESQNPVPVKNPAQYWSHWCDPYLDHLKELL